MTISDALDVNQLRDVGGECWEWGGGAAALPIGQCTLYEPWDTYGIEIEVHVGERTKTISRRRQGMGRWRHAASDAAKDIAAWVDANRASLR